MTEAAPDPKAKVVAIALWVLIVLETVLMAAAGASKFVAAEMWTGLFTGWGYPVWFTFVVGAAETAGALLLLFPRVSSYAAGFLIVIMLSAAGTLIINPSDMSVAPPLIQAAVLSIILQGRWSRRLT